MESPAKPIEKERIVNDTKLRKGDFFEAFKHPFNFSLNVAFCSMLFTILVIGQIILAIGGSVLFSAAAVISMLTMLLTFSVMTKTTQNFRQEKAESGFAPRLSRFTFWEDFIHPFFLGLGVYLVSFGLFTGSLLIFYFWLVYSRILGVTLYKIMPGEIVRQ